MCDTCEAQFREVAPRFEEMLKGHCHDIRTGLARPTPAERVHDCAETVTQLALTEGPEVFAWYLAIAMERLAALELSGLPT
jgi:hypothetical protein